MPRAQCADVKHTVMPQKIGSEDKTVLTVEVLNIFTLDPYSEVGQSRTR